MKFNESVVEASAIYWLQELGYSHVNGLTLAHDGPAPERSSYRDVILIQRFRDALQRINPKLPAACLKDVEQRVIRLESPSIEENNHTFQQWLSHGMEVSIQTDLGPRGDIAWLVDFEHPEQNDWLVVDQFTVVEGKHNRRPDLVVFLNGLPIGVLELKNPETESATLKSAWNQLQTYKAQIPSLFATNEILVISDGIDAKVGSLTAGFKRFGPWRTVDGQELAPERVPKLEVLIKGLFEPRRLLDYIRYFVLWESDESLIKKIAGYHQFHAVNKAVAATIEASCPSGDKRIGVVWHTQGSGKSISMAFYAGKIIRETAMENPTLVVITDRNDLDGQLFAQFCAARDLIPAPQQAENREHLRELLQVASGGVVFTTIQKFSLTEDERTLAERYPTLSDRRNIVVIADEAHRSQYGFETRIDAASGEVTYGLARNVRDALPNASFIGFTGTPIEFDDKSTPVVFGDYIDTYPISQAVEDGATVPLYYEARLARVKLIDDKKPLDDAFEEVTEGEEEVLRSKLKSKWAKLEAMVGTDERLGQIAADISEHWGRRLAIHDGKAMIVCMSRRVCVDLYQALVKLHPEWHDEDDRKGTIKVVMTGSASDPPSFRPHVRNIREQKLIEKRFKDPADPLQLVIVRDMWLTGFDVPCAHTLYLDKPMKGHGLMQAIARVNRVFEGKEGGLIVDYLGLAEHLRKAIGHFDARESKEQPSDFGVEQKLEVLLEKFGVVKTMFHGLDISGFFSIVAAERLAALAAGVDHILRNEDVKKRFLEQMILLNKAMGLAGHRDETIPIQRELAFFQAVQRNIRKYTVTAAGGDTEALEASIKQIISGAVASEGVIDLFTAAGLNRPDISILSDEFLETLTKQPYRNLQLELLRKLIAGEVKAIGQRNLVQSRKFSEMLERTILSYQNRSLETTQVIQELIELAKQIRDTPNRAQQLGITEDELAFYDALVDHGNVQEVMGDQILANIAHELTQAIRRSVTIDWTQKEAVRARMRTKIKGLLRRYKYPPDKRHEAVETVIRQAEVLCRDWAEVA